MCKAILMMLLAIVSSHAAAEWVEVGRSESATTYADPASIRKADNMVTMWMLSDFKAVQARPYGTPYMSQKTQQEYDCKEERARIVYFLRYSENMGGGEVVYTESDPDAWKPVPPDGTNEVLWKFACGR
jgi:hypothetical protein